MKEEKEGEVCEACESEQATVRCEECSGALTFCQCCFEVSHRSPNKKAHIAKPLVKSPLRISTDLTLQMYKCQDHVLEAKKYVCVECKTVACADCFVVGKHIHHRPRSFEEAVQEIMQAFIQELEDARQAHFQAKELVDNVTEQQRRAALAFPAYIANIQEALTRIRESFETKVAELLSIIANEEKKVTEQLAAAEKQAQELHGRLEHRVRYLQDSLEHLRTTINPDNYDKLKALSPDNLHQVSKNGLAQLRAGLAGLSCFEIPPQLGVDRYSEALRELYFLPNPKLRVEATYRPELGQLAFELRSTDGLDNVVRLEVFDRNQETDLGAATIDSKSKTALYSNYKMSKEPGQYRVSLGIPWNFVDCQAYKQVLGISSGSRFVLRHSKPAEDFCTLVKDNIRGDYYLGPTFNACQTLYRFKNLSDFMERKRGDELVLEQPFDGWYIAVKNGHLYHNIAGSNRVGVTDLATRKLLDTCQLPYASSHNGAGTFAHRGYTDIALFLDPRTDKLYVMYETENSQEFKISELFETEESRLRLGNTWILKGERKGSMCYAFMHSDTVYFGLSNTEAALQKFYNLVDCRMLSIGPIRITASGQRVDAHYASFVPSDRVMIVCMSEPYRICIYDVQS